MEKSVTAGEATDNKSAHALYMLDTKGYKHTLCLCNTYRFSTATMVALTLLNVTFYVHYVSGCFSFPFGRVQRLSNEVQVLKKISTEVL